MILILILSFLQSVMADISVEPYFNEGGLPRDNTFANLVLAASACTCVGVACSHKLFPIKVSEEDERYTIESDKESTENYKEDIKKLKRDLREFQKMLTQLDKV